MAGAYDTLDSIYFPREGLFGSVTWLASRESLGADDDYSSWKPEFGWWLARRERLVTKLGLRETD